MNLHPGAKPECRGRLEFSGEGYFPDGSVAWKCESCRQIGKITFEKQLAPRPEIIEIAAGIVSTIQTAEERLSR